MASTTYADIERMHPLEVRSWSGTQAWTWEHFMQGLALGEDRDWFDLGPTCFWNWVYCRRHAAEDIRPRMGLWAIDPATAASPLLIEQFEAAAKTFGVDELVERSEREVVRVEPWTMFVATTPGVDERVWPRAHRVKWLSHRNWFARVHMNAERIQWWQRPRFAEWNAEVFAAENLIAEDEYEADWVAKAGTWEPPRDPPRTR